MQQEIILNTKLSNAIKKKDFLKAYEIQNKINALKQNLKT